MKSMYSNPRVRSSRAYSSTWSQDVSSHSPPLFNVKFMCEEITLSMALNKVCLCSSKSPDGNVLELGVSVMEGIPNAVMHAERMCVSTV